MASWTCAAAHGASVAQRLAACQAGGSLRSHRDSLIFEVLSHRKHDMVAVAERLKARCRLRKGRDSNPQVRRGPRFFRTLPSPMGEPLRSSLT